MMASSEVVAVKPPNPTRPSRQPKESTALLMSVIRSISASENNEHRDKEKAKLEKEFKKSDQKLDELIASHHESLGAVIQAFGKVSSRLIVSRQKIRLIKENLASCKSLLNCRREELKRLWLEGIEHKHTLYLLEKIESLRGVPEKIEKYKQKKLYLHATDALVSSVKKIQEDLEGIDALMEVKHELFIKEQDLQRKIIEELHHHLYIRNTDEICGLYRGIGDTSPFSRHDSDYSNTNIPFARRGGIKVSHENRLDLSTGAPLHKYRQHYRTMFTPLSPLGSGNSFERPSEDLFSDPEADSFHFIAILVECLALLNKIPFSVEMIKGRMHKELVNILRKTTQLFADCGSFSQEIGFQHSAKGHLLQEFLELLFEQFHSIAQSHECFLSNLRRLSHTPGNQAEIQLYEMAEYWSCVQVVLQMLLCDYLDIENTTSTTKRSSSTFVESAADIGFFFSKKRPVKPKKFSLFKFEASSHAISLNSYLKEQQTMYGSDDMLGGIGKRDPADKFYICRPNPKNILSIFIPLMKFIHETETALSIPEGSHCELHVFITNFIRDVIEGQIHEQALVTIENATKGAEAWKANTDLDMQKNLNLSRPLLQSTLRVERCIQELRDVMQDLPLHAQSFLTMICSFLGNYNSICLTAYNAIVQPGTDKRIISATWAKDEDINRFLRSLPNWMNLKTDKGQTSVSNDIEESPEDIRLRNKKESEMLTRNLGEGTIPMHEILSDVSQLRVLALLQESMEWFGSRINELIVGLQTDTMLSGSPNSSPQHATLEVPPIPTELITTLQRHAREFEGLADMCLLVLHLEVRVHCFYHLLPVAKQASFASGVDSQDPDPEVVKLNKDFSSIDEALSTSLQPRKFRYVFEGLGHLVSSILINSAQYIKRINENGVKKMCRNIFGIQQNLTNITLSREVALDHARHYFELLYHSPEEILNRIVEHGPKFTELDYRNALQLLHQSRPGSDPGELRMHVNRLHDILNEVAVTI